MTTTYRSADWDTYQMTYSSPHKALESPEAGNAVVDAARSEYMAFVRDPSNFRASVNVILDPEGLEVSVK